MRNLLVAAVITLAGALTAPSASAQPDIALPSTNIGSSINGVIHCHTTFSDGIYTIEEVAQIAKNHGAKFLVVTDHFEDIELTKEQYEIVGNPISAPLSSLRNTQKQYGIENYIKACKDATRKVGILVVPGVEVGIGTERDLVFDPVGGTNSDNIIHMLGIGCITTTIANRIHMCLGHDGASTYGPEDKTIRLDDAQESISKILHDAGFAVVIAHPYLPGIHDGIHGFHYTLYKNRMDYIDGIEFFNGSGTNDENSMEAMGFINRDALMGEFKDLAPTAGCDFHGFPVISDEELFDRQTILSVTLPSVWNDNNFESGCKLIADAIRGNGTVGAIVKDPKTKEVLSLLSSANNLDSLDSLASQVSIYQKGNKIFGGNDAEPTEELDEKASVYVHAPERAMIRLSMSAIGNTGNTNDLIPPETVAPSRPGDTPEPTQQIGDLRVETSTMRWSVPIGFKSVGGTDEIEITVDNRHGDKQTLRFEPGMLFVVATDPAGDEYQPLVVIESCSFSVEAGQNGTGRVDTVCANSRVVAPPRNLDMVYIGTNPVLGSVITRALATDENDVQNAVWEYTNERMWHGAAAQHKIILATNDSGREITIFLAWHDEEGWHNTNWSSKWTIPAGKKNTRLVFENQEFRADQIRYWATDGKGEWRHDQKNEVVDLSELVGDTYTVIFR